PPTRSRGRARSRSPRARSTSGAEPPGDLGHDLALVGPAAAEQPHEEAALARRDRLAVDDHVELAAGADLDLRLDPRLALDAGGEPRRPGSVASGLAVQDPDVHGRPPRLDLRVYSAGPSSGRSSDRAAAAIRPATCGARAPRRSGRA